MQLHHHHVLGSTNLAKSARSPATTHDDADLLDLVEQFNRLEKESDALWRTTDGAKVDEISQLPRAKILWQAQVPLFARIMQLRATTPEGWRALAQMLRLLDKEMEREFQDADATWTVKRR